MIPLLLGQSSVSHMAEKEVISTEKAPGAIGPYSQAIKVNGTIFVSGQIPIDPTNAQYAVQPAAHAGNLVRFASPTGPTTFAYSWGRKSIAFSGGPLWSYSGPDFWAGKAPVHINVWQFQGRPPAGGQDVEIVFRSFSYQP